MAAKSPTVRFLLTMTPELSQMIQDVIPRQSRAYTIEKLLWSHPYFRAYIRKTGIKEPRRRRLGRPLFARNKAVLAAEAAAAAALASNPDDTMVIEKPKRGRPRKVVEEVTEPLPRRKRGRPSKNPQFVSARSIIEDALVEDEVTVEDEQYVEDENIVEDETKSPDENTISTESDAVQDDEWL